MTNSTVHIEDALVTGGTKRGRLSRTAGFWAVAASMSVLTAFSTAPSALYGIYRRQDHLSSITVTIVYAVFAAGIVTSLLLVGHLSDWYGRRTLLIPALLTGLVAAVIFSPWVRPPRPPPPT
jgi:MFS family permease